MSSLTPAEAVEILRRFVVRAVRIEAHSLLNDRARLARDAHGTMHITSRIDGTARIEREFPDEERMESLASRLRPLTLASEPIHHRKVMDAIDLVLGLQDPGLLGRHRSRIDQLRDAWHEWGLDQDSAIGYSLSYTTVAGSGPPVEATDVQLAAGWFYTDVAHANPTGWKEGALQFPRATRFEAAVPRFSLLAITALSTLDFIRELQGSGALAIPTEAFTPDPVQTREVVEEAIVMVAPLGTPPPPGAGEPFGTGWEQLNVGSAARLIPANRIDVVLRTDGQEVARREGAILDKGQPDEDTHTMAVLVDEAVIFNVVSKRVNTTGELRIDRVWTTNRALSDGDRLLGLIDSSDTLAFVWEDRDRFTYTLDHSAFLVGGAAVADFADDVAALEAMLDVKLPLITRIPNLNRQLDIRLARLAMGGDIVEGPHGPVVVTAPPGRPPHGILLTIRPLEVEGQELMLRPLLMWHPDAQSEPDEEPGKYRVTIPHGDPFLVWDPAVTNIQTDSELLPTARMSR